MINPYLSLDIQVENIEDSLPSANEFENWIARTLEKVQMQPQTTKNTHRLINVLEAGEAGNVQAIELAIRIVNEEEGSCLNETYRGKAGPTNVLSFPFAPPEALPSDLQVPLLGDIIICAPVVKKQALEQNKPEKNHWAHLTVHGTLHLLGYDHVNNEEANIMEDLEVIILNKLGFPDPYNGPENNHH